MKFFYQMKRFFILWIVPFLFLVSSCKKKEVNFADKTPPVVVSTYPANGVTGVSVKIEKIVVSFSEDIDPNSVNFSSFSISPLTYGALKVLENKIFFYPYYPLQYDTTYKIIIRTKVTDLFGNHLRKSFAFSFSTEHDTTPPPPPMFYSTYFITNQNPLIIGGVKQAGSGIKVNGEVYVPIDYSTSFNLQLPLIEGENRFKVVAFDKAGNESKPVYLTAVLDTVPPSQPEVNYPEVTREDIVPIYGTKDTDSEVIVTDTGSGYQVCRRREVSQTWGCKIKFPTEGTKCFNVVAIDAAGNSSAPISFCIKRDITPPSSFSLDSTSSTQDKTLVVGTKASSTYLFLNGKKISEVEAPFEDKNWQSFIIPQDGENILNFSLTDKVFNSTQFVYSFYHMDKPPVLVDSYPNRGTTFSAPVSEITLYFDSPVTISKRCNLWDFIVDRNGYGLRVNKIDIEGPTVKLFLSEPIQGDNLTYIVNTTCFENWIPSEPEWWIEYPKVATTDNGKRWEFHFRKIDNTGYSSAPVPLYSSPVSVSCNFYQCGITVSPFFADNTGSKEEVLMSLFAMKNRGGKSSIFKETKFSFRIPPFSCPNIDLEIKNMEGMTSKYYIPVTPTAFLTPVTSLTSLNVSSYYVKMVTGDWNGDGIKDIALSVIKNPEGYRFSPVEVIIIFGSPVGGYSSENIDVLNFKDTGYGIAVSYGELKDYVLLTQPSTGKLAIFSPSYEGKVSTNAYKWVDLSEKFKTPGKGIGIDITNVGDLSGIKNSFLIVSDSSSSDNVFWVNDRFEPLFSAYQSGLSGRYSLFKKGYFATRGENEKTLCIQDYNFDYGRGKVVCYYGGKDFPQEYPYFSVTDSVANYLTWFGYQYELVDFNGDGFDDLIAGTYGDKKLIIYWGGDYPDLSPDMIINYPLKFFMTGVKVADKDYLLVANRQNSKLQVLYNDNGRTVTYDACINGMSLTAWDKLYQIDKNHFLLFKAASPTSTSADLFILTLPR